MKTETFHFELLTPCFCGGADPIQQAEIRAPSIRGQLRWWFRTLGGFRSLPFKNVRDQENRIFGSTAGEKGEASKLYTRVTNINCEKAVRDGQDLGHKNFSDEAYLTFPIQSRERQGQKISNAGKAVLLKGTFDLIIVWRGEERLWEDIKALVSVWGSLGSLGFRSRRAMGALGWKGNAPDLRQSLNHFNHPNAIVIKQIMKNDLNSAKSCITALGAWLKSWREHGRTPNLAVNQPGFDWARRDHNEGLRMLTGRSVTNNPPGHSPKGNDGDSFRPAIGLPIVQYFSSIPKGQPNTVMWDWESNNRDKKGEGRFASPVLLRPYRDADGKWHALVIFVDAHKWPDNKLVHLHCSGRHETRSVSLDLYNRMKKDSRLQPFV